MIRDVVIIKDGMPLLSRNYADSPSPFSVSDNLIMMSGFFSAINSFSDQFDGLGQVSELKLSNTDDTRVSFLRDPSLPNLVYMATFDESTKGVNVQRTLRKISKTFLQKYNVQSILNWRGRRNAFQAFEENISQFVKEEKEENEQGFKDKVIELFNNVKDKINENEQPSQKIENKLPSYSSEVPSLTLSKKINPKHFLTGEISCKVFERIDGKKNLEDLADELKFPIDKIHSTCKSMVKMGFISLNHN